MEQLKFESVLIRGTFYFIGNPDSNFKGPIVKGFRPIVWLDSISKSTSCSFIFEGKIIEGEEKEVDIVILNQLQLDGKIDKGTILNIGSISHKIGYLIVSEHLGLWKGGKVP